MIRRTAKILVYGATGVVAYTVANKNPYEQFKKPEIKEVIAREPFSVQLFLHLPLNAFSRLFGKISQLEVPSFLRRFLYSAYVSFYKVDLSEAENEDLKSYKTFTDFFTRSLKGGARPIHEPAALLSPSDGLILSMGRVEASNVTHVKDKDYTLEYFIGPKTWHLANEVEAANEGLLSRVYRLISGSPKKSQELSILERNDVQASSSPPSLSPPLSSSPPSSPSSISSPSSSSVSYPESLKSKQSNHLYHCTIYLAPGDYHRFHSPADWKCIFRRHFPGYLLSVSPRMANRMPELMNMNERVLYVGEWRHGFMCLALVGATNVGSIRVYSDPTLNTNARANLPVMIDTHFRDNHPKSISSPAPPSSSSSPPLLPQINPPPSSSAPSSDHPQSVFLAQKTFTKGEPFGQFNLGSTVVLLFEAPPHFKFVHQVGDKLKFGQPL